MNKNGEISLTNKVKAEEAEIQVQDYGQWITQKNSGVFDISIELNITPSAKWIDFFNSPQSYSSHPYFKSFEFSGDRVAFRCKGQEKENFINQLKDYIRQANEQYLNWIDQEEKEEQRRAQQNAERAQRAKSVEDDFKKII